MTTTDDEHPTTKPEDLDPRIKDPPRPHSPWRASELAAWVVLALLAIGVYWQHRRLAQLRADLRDEIETTSKAADKRTSDRLDHLTDRVGVAERQVRECVDAINNGAIPR